MVTGKVTGLDGLGLPGASVFVSDANGNIKPGATGTAANATGAYSLAANEDDFITASFVGMKKKTVTVIDSAMVFDFVLTPNNTLPEVTIYGEKEKPLIPDWVLWLVLALIGTAIGGAIILF